MNPVLHKSGLSVAGLLVACGCALGPAVAAHAAPPESGPTTTVPPQTGPTTFTPPQTGPAKGAQADKGGHDRRAERFVQVDYQAQPNFFYCGPAATRIALSAQGKAISQDDVAALLGTTEAGTPSALDTTRVLNQLTGGKYRTIEIPDATARPTEVERLRTDAMKALDDGRPVVANVKGTAVDANGVPHSYEGGHYVTLIGYRDGGDSIQIADPADPTDSEYWMPLAKVANWIAERGYSA